MPLTNDACQTCCRILYLATHDLWLEHNNLSRVTTLEFLHMKKDTKLMKLVFKWVLQVSLHSYTSHGIVLPTLIEMRRLTVCGVNSRFGVLDCVRIEKADWILIAYTHPFFLCSWLWLSRSFEIPFSLCPECWAKQILSPLSCNFFQGIFSQQLKKKLICVWYYAKLITDITKSL